MLLLQIKIEKKKGSDPESDIEIDIDSDKEENSDLKNFPHVNDSSHATALKMVKDDLPVAVPLRKFEPMPKRRKKINLVGNFLICFKCILLNILINFFHFMIQLMTHTVTC